MDVSEEKRLKRLDEEIGKLRRLLAVAMLYVPTLRETLGRAPHAWMEKDRRDLGHRELGLYATSYLWARQYGAAGLPLSLEPTRRH